MKPTILLSAAVIIAASLMLSAAPPADKATAELTLSSPLRYVSVAEALAAVQKHLDPVAVGAISQIDLDRNVITLKADHPLAGKVREFLGSLDHPPQQVRFTGTVIHHEDATATSPARDEVISHPTITGLMNHPMTLDIPGDHGSTRIEFQVGLP
jgi:hypothetical protein